jgi:hypothetical protein
MMEIERYRRETLATLEIGEQINVNHLDCPAGDDTRKRLYILRKSDSMWLGFCHNCGESGFYFNKDKWDTASKDLVDELQDLLKSDKNLEEPCLISSNKLALPHDVTSDWMMWDNWACDRINSAGIPVTHIVEEPYFWRYSPSRRQIITPIYTTTDDPDRLVGYQCRNPNGFKPKCITTYVNGREGYPLIYRHDSIHVVFVEDPLSAVRVHHDLGVTCVALLGSHLSAKALSEVMISLSDISGLRKFTVWLDNDAAGRSAVGPLAKSLRNFTPSPVKIVSLEEPKNITTRLTMEMI